MVKCGYVTSVGRRVRLAIVILFTLVFNSDLTVLGFIVLIFCLFLIPFYLFLLFTSHLFLVVFVFRLFKILFTCWLLIFRMLVCLGIYVFIWKVFRHASSFLFSWHSIYVDKQLEPKCEMLKLYKKPSRMNDNAL